MKVVLDGGPADGYEVEAPDGQSYLDVFLPEHGGRSHLRCAAAGVRHRFVGRYVRDGDRYVFHSATLCAKVEQSPNTGI